MSYQLFINNIELDINKGVVFPLTYSQSDAKNPEKRKRNSSKSIELPGTKRNNQFFMSAWDLSISDVRGDSLGFEFDPTLKYPAIVKRNGKEIFRGTVNLQKVIQKKLEKATVNTFQILLYSEITNLMQSLGDITIAELGWSDYDHTLSVVNIENSWSAATGSGYFYPLIDFGYTDDTLSYKTNELRPYVYKKEILEKCFEYGGLTMASDFWDATRQRKIVWGFGGGEQIQLDSTSVNNRRSKYTGDGIENYSFNFSSFSSLQDKTKYEYTNTIQLSDNDIVNMTVVQDISSQYDEDTGELVVFNDGDYKLSVVADLDLTYGFSNPVLPGQNIQIIAILRIFKNFALVNNQVIFKNDTSSGTQTVNFSIIQDFQLDAGDVISADIQLKTIDTSVDGFQSAVTFDLDIDFNNTIDMDFQAINIELIDGDNVEVARFLPKMKATDFLKDIILMYNMYMSDPDAENNIVFEPIDEYFYPTDDVDQWSDLVDRSKQVEIEPASNIQGKVYSFKFAEDRDYYKKLYFDRYGIDYGDYDYNVPSTFKTGTKLYRLKMAQSCPVQIEGSDLVIPRIIQVDESTLISSPHKGKPRFFFNNGLIASDDWNLVNSDTGVATTMTSYPSCHHLDDLTSPTFDLNFGVPQWVFYTATNYTSNNLFQNNHAQAIRELTSRDSKIVTAFFKLDENDLYKNFMRRLCNIDGVLYRKNIVKDFRATSHEMTKVELIKIVKGNTRKKFTIPVYTLPLTKMSYGGDPDTPITSDINAKSSQRAYNLDTSSNDLVVTVDPESLRQGWIGEFKKLESSNDLTIQVPKLSTSTIDGEASITLKNQYDSATLYFDGVNFKLISAVGTLSGGTGGNKVTDISANTTADTSTKTYKVDTSSSDVTLTLPQNQADGQTWYIKKTSNKNKLTVTSIDLINGNLNQIIKNLDTAIKVTYDLSNNTYDIY